jgi:hypothetical protein
VLVSAAALGHGGGQRVGLDRNVCKDEEVLVNVSLCAVLVFLFILYIRCELKGSQQKVIVCYPIGPLTEFIVRSMQQFIHVSL